MRPYYEIIRRYTVNKIKEDTNPNQEPRQKLKRGQNLFARLWQWLFSRQHQQEMGPTKLS